MENQKKKLRLDDLKVESFVTAEQIKDTAYGGGPTDSMYCGHSDCNACTPDHPGTGPWNCTLNYADTHCQYDQTYWNNNCGGGTASGTT